MPAIEALEIQPVASTVLRLEISPVSVPSQTVPSWPTRGFALLDPVFALGAFALTEEGAAGRDRSAHPAKGRWATDEVFADTAADLLQICRQ
jgi:hypothetical protein